MEKRLDQMTTTTPKLTGSMVTKGQMNNVSPFMFRQPSRAGGGSEQRPQRIALHFALHVQREEVLNSI
jgi:hypothetical protein